MRTNPNEPSLRGVIRPIPFLFPDQSAADVLRVFVHEHVHIAVVRDREGTTLGLVTLEDLVEELVGELEDEFDSLPRMFHTLSGGMWMMGGGLPVAEVARRLGTSLSDQQGTVSAWLSGHLGRAPKVGDEYQEAGLKFVVRRIRRGKASEVVASRLPPLDP
jgi:putative hemolysin